MLLSTAFPSDYSGVIVDERAGALIVYRKPNPKLDEAVRKLADDRGVDISFVDTRYSAEFMKSLVARIQNDRSYWRQHDVDIASFGPSDGVNCAAQVIAPGNVSRNQQLMDQRYGAGLVVVEEGALLPLTGSAHS